MQKDGKVAKETMAVWFNKFPRFKLFWNFFCEIVSNALVVPVSLTILTSY